jgi:hypothetical protein
MSFRQSEVDGEGERREILYAMKSRLPMSGFSWRITFMAYTVLFHLVYLNKPKNTELTNCKLPTQNCKLHKGVACGPGFTLQSLTLAGAPYLKQIKIFRLLFFVLIGLHRRCSCI